MGLFSRKGNTDKLYETTMKYNYLIRSLFPDPEISKDLTCMFLTFGWELYCLNHFLSVPNSDTQKLVQSLKNALFAADVSNDGVLTGLSLIHEAHTQCQAAIEKSASAPHGSAFSNPLYLLTKQLFSFCEVPFDITFSPVITGGLSEYIEQSAIAYKK